MSTVFNASYYLSNNADVVLAISQGTFSSAAQHFNLFGGRELRDPNSTFNSNYYSVQNPDVLTAVSTGAFPSAFAHFSEFGLAENRAPTVSFASFDAAAYLTANADIAAAVTAGTISSALDHYMAFGATEARLGSGIDASVLNPGTSFELTTGTNSGTNFTGGTGDDDFNAGLSSSSTNTLNALDRLDGGAGTDTLSVVLASDVTPGSLKNIESVVATASGGARILGLNNAEGVTSVTSSSAGQNLTVNGINAGATLNVQSVSATNTFNYATVTGTQSVNVGVNAASGAANITVAGVEDVTVTSTGSASTYVLVTAAATSKSFLGASNQTVTTTGSSTSVSSYDGSGMTGNLNLTLIDSAALQSTVDVTVKGGAGNDTLNVSVHTTSDVNVDGGAGDDKIINTVLGAADTVDGGAGTDEISMLNAAAQTLDAAAATTVLLTNIEQIEITDQLAAGTLTTQNIVASDKITLSSAGAAGALLAGAANVVGAAGAYSVDLGHSVAGNTTRVLGAQLTITDTGSAVTDSVTIANKSNAGTGTAELDVFDGRDIISTGYETVSIVTGANNGAVRQDIGTLTITADAITAPVNLNLSGNASIDINSLSTNSQGLMTVDGTDLSIQSTGTTMDIATTVHGTGGTASITGTGGADSLIVGDFASTIIGGGGADTITGGAVADNIQGGDGNDIIGSGGGNDVIDGGLGVDTITVGTATAVSVNGGAGNDIVNMASTLTGSDTIDGGEGTDTLRIGVAATASDGAGLSNFEVLQIDAVSITQDMVQFSSNQGFTRINANAAGAVTVNNISSSVADVRVVNGATNVAFDRLLDNTTNAITVAALTNAATTITAVTVDDEETITIDDGAMTTTGTNFTIGTLNADDAKAITLTGVSDFLLTNAVAGANDTLVTFDASANTGTVVVDLNASTVNLTFTGSATKGNTLSGGTKDDLITGGSGVDSLSGDAGSDTIIGSGGADVLIGAGGADSLLGGEGSDSITGGSGSDTIDLTEGTSVVDHVVMTHGAAAASQSSRVQQTGDDNDTGKDTIIAAKFGTDQIDMTLTGVVNFSHYANVTIGTASGDSDDGTAGSFLTSVGLMDINPTTAGAFVDAGDVAINFVPASTAAADQLTAAKFQAMFNYTLTGTTAANTIGGGIFNDTINVDLTGNTSDRIVFGASAALNGNDAITGFESGVIGTDGDRLDFAANGFVTGRAINANGIANTGTDLLVDFTAALTGVVDADGKVVVFDHAGITQTASNIAAEFAAVGTAFTNSVANNKTVVIAGNDGGDTLAQVFYVDFALDGDGTSISTADVVQVATLPTALDVDAITGGQIL